MNFYYIWIVNVINKIDSKKKKKQRVMNKLQIIIVYRMNQFKNLYNQISNLYIYIYFLTSIHINI